MESPFGSLGLGVVPRASIQLRDVRVRIRVQDMVPFAPSLRLVKYTVQQATEQKAVQTPSLMLSGLELCKWIANVLFYAP